MTNPASIQTKAISAILEPIDADDAKDAEVALKLIRAMLMAAEPKS